MLARLARSVLAGPGGNRAGSYKIGPHGPEKAIELDIISIVRGHLGRKGAGSGKIGRCWPVLLAMALWHYY